MLLYVRMEGIQGWEACVFIHSSETNTAYIMQTLFRYKGIFSWYYKASKYPTNHSSTIIILLIFNNFENRLAKFDKNSTFSVPPSFFFLSQATLQLLRGSSSRLYLSKKFIIFIFIFQKFGLLNSFEQRKFGGYKSY